MPEQQFTGAYSFVCQYNATDALARRLNEISDWKWGVGDSYWYGDYCVARPFPGVRIRIIDFPKGAPEGWLYDSDIRIDQKCVTPTAVIDAAYRKILAAIPAHDIQAIESFD